MQPNFFFIRYLQPNTRCYGRDGQVARSLGLFELNMLDLVIMKCTNNFHAAELPRWALT